MIPEIVVIPDNVVMYLRFSTEEQAKGTPMILHKSEAIKLANKILDKIKKVPYQISLNGSDD